eukprot:626145-Rhodomonas_salina.1
MVSTRGLGPRVYGLRSTVYMMTWYGLYRLEGLYGGQGAGGGAGGGGGDAVLLPLGRERPRTRR